MHALISFLPISFHLNWISSTPRHPAHLWAISPLGSARTAGGIVDAGPAYQKNLSEEVTKLQRLYGGGDFAKFPDFKFSGQLSCLVCVSFHVFATQVL